MGKFENVRFVDEVKDLPEAVCLNEELMNKIRYLQMVDVELAYRKYLELYQQAYTLSLEEMAKTITFLETEREITMKNIQSILNPQTEGDK